MSSPWPDTIDGALALPKFWGVSAAFVEHRADFFGKENIGRVIQAYTCARWNGFAVPLLFNIYLYRVIGCYLALSLLRRLLSLTPLASSRRRLPPSLQRAHNVLVKHLSLSPFIGESALEPVSIVPYPHPLARWTTIQIPLRLHGVVLATFVCLNLYLAFAQYSPLTQDNIFFPEEGFPYQQLFRYFADRTAILAIGTTPLCIALAARNSPISWLTGLSFSTLQIYHRVISRVTFLSVFFHAVAYSYLILAGGGHGDVAGLRKLVRRPYLVWGWVAYFGGVVLCIASWRRLREIAYEVFLIGHILGALAWTIGAWWHIRLLHEQSHLLWMNLAIAFWLFDRSLRVWSLILNNSPLFRRVFASRSLTRHRAGTFHAEGYLIGGGDGDFVRLRITPSRKWRTKMGRPGTYVYISSPQLRLWESHPFSLSWPLDVPDEWSACASSVASSTPSESSSALSLVEPLVPELGDNGDYLPHAFDDACLATGDSFELIIKSYSGFTQRLAKAMEEAEKEERDDDEEQNILFSGSGPRKVKILVEGPYGEIRSHEKYSHVMLVSGGSGVAATTAHLADMVKHACSGTLLTRRVSIVWSIRDMATLQVLLPYLFRLSSLFPPQAAPLITLSLYITRPSSSPSAKPLALPPILHSLTVHHGRPELGVHVDELLQEISTEDSDRIIVGACGPQGLCDRAREAVRSRVGNDEKQVDAHKLTYCEEAETW